MDAHTESHTSDIAAAAVDTAPAPAFVQVLYVGRSGSAELVEALRRDGVGVIVAFDHERAARLLRHFRPDAILCAPADASELLRCAEPNVPVLTFPDDEPRRASHLGNPPVNVAAGVAVDVSVDVAAVARRLREEIAARRSSEGHSTDAASNKEGVRFRAEAQARSS
jgi:hypothetical protein